MAATAPAINPASPAPAANGSAPHAPAVTPLIAPPGLADSPAVAAAIASITDALRARSASITDVRPARDAAAKSAYDAFMARCADLRGRALLYPYVGSGVGNGALVELLDGSVKWDMISGIGVQFFGHSDPDLTAAAVRGALSDVVMQGNLQANADAYAFADLLVRHASKASRLRHVYLSTAGAMANENALKVCYQKHAPASRVLAFKDCFMGRTVTMSQIGDAAANRIGLPLSTLVDYMPFYDEAAVQRMGGGTTGRDRYIQMAVSHLEQYIERYPKQHACFIFELVQGEGGFNTAPREFFTALMDVCKRAGIAVWADEIQTFGRTERMFAFEWLDLGQYIDVLTVGKMTQACATLFTADYNPGPGLLSGTFIGGGVPFAVGTRVIERLATSDAYGPQGRHARQHKAFVEQVRALAARRPEWFGRDSKWGALPDIAGGVGGMMRFTPFNGDKDRIMKACKAMFDEGVIVFYAGHGPYHVRMLPPLGVFNEADWPRVFACVERGLAKAAG